MATRSENTDPENIEIRFEEIEDALYALAAFKKPQDISVIKVFLNENIWQISRSSFLLMKEFPNETYLDIFEKFYQEKFYSKIYTEKNYGIAVEFINSIASYKNERSEKILNSMLNRKPFLPYNCNTIPLINKSLRKELIFAIWNNPCKAYAKIRGQIKNEVREFEENDKKNQIESPLLNVDTTFTEINKPKEKEPVTWWH
jgi:hypothetical protein